MDSTNVIRGPWRVSMRLPLGTRFWDVQGVPVAVIPTHDSGSLVRAYDSPLPRPFARGALIRYGAYMSCKAWDSLVDQCLAQRPTVRPIRGFPIRLVWHRSEAEVRGQCAALAPVQLDPKPDEA
jgi:hypothetical protein